MPNPGEKLIQNRRESCDLQHATLHNVLTNTWQCTPERFQQLCTKFYRALVPTLQPGQHPAGQQQEQWKSEHQTWPETTRLVEWSAPPGASKSGMLLPRPAVQPFSLLTSERSWFFWVSPLVEALPAHRARSSSEAPTRCSCSSSCAKATCKHHISSIKHNKRLSFLR